MKSRPSKPRRGAAVAFPFLTRRGIRAVLFDWDGVVIDSAPDYFRAYELALAPEGVKPSAHEVLIREGMRTAQVIAALFADREMPVSKARLAALVERRRRFYARAARSRFFPGIWRLLRALRRAGFKPGLVTGSSRKHDVLPLTPAREKRFDVVVTADDSRRPKPNPEPYRTAIRKLGLRPKECLVVENAPSGIVSAHRAGCRVVALCTTLKPKDLREADWVVANHHELIELLSR
jgi:beta-phosphoglucomutase